MIERRVIDGRTAILVFLNGDYVVVSVDEATQAKAIFDDGEIMWMDVEDREPVDDDETVDDFLERMKGYWEGA
jgi:hypothetical protein